jgi:hypothetical protein
MIARGPSKTQLVFERYQVKSQGRFDRHFLRDHSCSIRLYDIVST